MKLNDVKIGDVLKSTYTGNTYNVIDIKVFDGTLMVSLSGMDEESSWFEFNDGWKNLTKLEEDERKKIKPGDIVTSQFSYGSKFKVLHIFKKEAWVVKVDNEDDNFIDLLSSFKKCFN